jgi:hypothetical protein
MSTEIELLKREISMLRYRTMAAELALYQLGDAIRRQSTHADDVVKKVHALNQQFPLGDADMDGVQLITINAIRASVPGTEGLSDAEVKARYLSPVSPDPEPLNPPKEPT